MPNLVGVGNSQISNNGMLGGMAYQDANNLVLDSVEPGNISKIKSEVRDTATDIFVYDTRKDSDGGAWRKRTKNASWYNETLGTATRGNRKEFPAVAIIVITNDTTGALTIYDGDDPNTPMWMRFDEGAGHNLWQGSDRSSVTALNGIIVVGQTTTVSLPIIEFVRDEIYNRRTDTTKYNMQKIIHRNTNTFPESDSHASYYAEGLINTVVNDVAMVVLPNSPIDHDTQLPVPLIAVATNGGVSVIRGTASTQDGNQFPGGTIESHVYDFTYTSTNDNNRSICLSKNGRMRYGARSYGTEDNFFIFVYDCVAYKDNGDQPDLWYSHGNTTQGMIKVVDSRGGTTSPINDVVDMGNNEFAFSTVNYSGAGAHGFAQVIEPEVLNVTQTPFNIMINYIGSDFNTGWIYGQTFGAFLSSTTVETLSADSELVTNGTFDSNTTGWTAGNSTLSQGSGQMTVTRSGGSGTTCYQDITTVVGQKYLVSAKINSSGSRGDLRVHSATNWGGSLILNLSGVNGETHRVSGTFFATSTTTMIGFTIDNNSTAIVVDDVSMVAVKEDDRSAAGQALRVYGAIDKRVVYPGSELVGYGPFSNTQFLHLPAQARQGSDTSLGHGSIIGTGDYYIMLWAKCSNYSGTDVMVSFWNGDASDQNSGKRMSFYLNSSTGKISLYQQNGGSSSNCNSDLIPVLDRWHHIVVVRRSNGTVDFYLDGFYNTKTATTQDLTQDMAINIGGDRGLTTTSNPCTHTQLSNVRVGKGNPDREQILRIYRDEKKMYHMNAKCTLHGSSDEVKAIAYDDGTDILHAGTSAGRSEFNGLVRINNTTTAVTTAISASNGIVAEQ